jgi:Mlc titration factor MtfA (ptsG expression regulator)
MVFAWLTEHRRRSILAEPFPPAWMDVLRRDMPSYACLTPEEQSRLCDLLRIFLAEKNWEGCGGLTLTDEIKVAISGQACLLILNLDREIYPNVESILVYPAAFVAKQPSLSPGGVVDESPLGLLGEAWSIGPVIVSWADAHDGGINPTDGRNVVYHEFAHKLDMRDGSADGVPRLADDAQYETWARVMSAEYTDLVKKAAHHQKSLLDAYGAVNAGEFFAVATECFFEKSVRMRETHSDLYGVLCGFYRQDPAARAEDCSNHPV